jgi:hypothetical protein
MNPGRPHNDVRTDDDDDNDDYEVEVLDYLVSK